MNQLPLGSAIRRRHRRDMRQHYRRFGIETRVFNLSTDVPIYVMMAVSLGDGEREPAALVGLGAHLNPRTAMDKALFEICQIRPGERRRFIEDGAGKNLRQYSDVKTLHDHSAFLMRPERRSELAFLLDHGRQQSLGELPDRSTGQTNRDLDTALSGLAAAGCRSPM
jgi:ribosomal protein S12 methylthiotransferase accessory factor